MGVKKILTLGKHDKLLRTKSEPVKKINKEVRQLIEDIRDTIDANPAVGLAAVQIGVMKRVFGARMAYKSDQEKEEMQPPTIFINPEILSLSEETEREFDACLSIPGMFGHTNRSLKVRLRYMDEDGHIQEREFEGWDARVIQHEYDHVEGVLFLDRLASLNDLMVYVRGEDGKTKAVPYSDAIRQAEQRAVEKKNAGGAG